MKENKGTIISKRPIILKKLVFPNIFIIKWIFIQSLKLDIFWKVEKTEKYRQSFFILWLKLKYGKNGLECKNWGFC